MRVTNAHSVGGIRLGSVSEVGASEGSAREAACKRFVDMYGCVSHVFA